MKKRNIFVFATLLALFACGQRELAPSAAAVDVAAQYCARNFKPWFDLGKTCKVEEGSGKSGASCATLSQANRIIWQRWSDSDNQKCSPAELQEMQALTN